MSCVTNTHESPALRQPILDRAPLLRPDAAPFLVCEKQHRKPRQSAPIRWQKLRVQPRSLQRFGMLLVQIVAQRSPVFHRQRLAHSNAQQVDSIYFHLYTDSLKKGTHNYINVDGKTADGRWLPMTSKDISFAASACEFSGNELVVPADFNGEKITIKAILKNRPGVEIEKTIWIKQKPDPQLLPTKEEVLSTSNRRRRH